MSSVKSVNTIIVFFLLLFTSVTYSQFEIVSTLPANGTVNVDTNATISITFNAAVDTSARFPHPGDFFMGLFFNPDSLVSEPDSISLSPDMHTVYLHNLHLSANTQYRFCLFNAVSMSGDSLAFPYSVTFSTNSVMTNTATVNGTVSYPGNNPKGALVLLFTANPFQQEDSNYKSWGIVSDSIGNYTVDYVESDFYWPAVVNNFFFDDEGELQIGPGSQVGFFDPNMDLRPDSIFVFSGTTINGVNITLKDVYPQTARNQLSQMNTVASNWASDAVHIGVTADELSPEGKALFWRYGYYSSSLDAVKIWMVIGDIITIVDMDSIDADTTALPLNWLDSDTIMAVAETNGGSEYRMQYPETRVFADCYYFTPDWIDKHKGNYFSKIAHNLNKTGLFKTLIWKVEYYSYQAMDVLEFYIDAETGMYLNQPVTAHQVDSLVKPIALDWSADVRLWNLTNEIFPLDSLGKGDLWHSIFYSPIKDSLFEIYSGGFLPIYSGTVSSVPIDTTTIRPGWINSDVALNTADANGGWDYRQSNQDVVVFATLGQWLNGAQPDSIVWVMEYLSSTSGGLTIVVDAYSGQIYSGTNDFAGYLPKQFELFQNYPNPFNAETTISFNLPKTSDIKIEIYNTLGQNVLSVNRKNMPAGSQKIKWHAAEIPSGVYFYKISAGEYKAIKKCILLK